MVCAGLRSYRAGLRHSQFRRGQCGSLGAFGRRPGRPAAGHLLEPEQPAQFLLNSFDKWVFNQMGVNFTKEAGSLWESPAQTNSMRVMEDNYRKRMLLGQDGNALVQ